MSLTESSFRLIVRSSFKKLDKGTNIMNIDITDEFLGRIDAAQKENPTLSLTKIARIVEMHKSTLAKIKKGDTKSMDPGAYYRLDYFLKNHRLLAQGEPGFKLGDVKSFDYMIEDQVIKRSMENWQNVVDALNDTIAQQAEEIKKLKEIDRKQRNILDKINIMSGYESL